MLAAVVIINTLLIDRRQHTDISSLYVRTSAFLFGYFSPKYRTELVDRRTSFTRCFDVYSALFATKNERVVCWAANILKLDAWQSPA